ncbi:hypothetical protein [Pectobacterium carotovorum]|uniref:hypothetical protein n=1 Tax=Pectobacterium carotovorum TaxID=554 RepID=UPI0013F40E2E
MADIPYPAFFLSTQLVKRYRPYRIGSPVTGRTLPATQGPQTQIDFTTGNHQPCARCYRFIDPDDELFPFIFRRQSSSSVSP